LTTDCFYENKCAILEMLGRFQKLNGTEITDLTHLSPKDINDVITYFRNLGAVNVKGKHPPFNFQEISLTKDGKRLYTQQFLEGKFESIHHL
jgi:hypothetical protein